MNISSTKRKWIIISILLFINSTRQIAIAEISSIDSIAPTITFNPLRNANTSNRNLNNFATILDNTEVSTSNRPRLYYKKSTDADVFGGNTSSDNGWKYVVSPDYSSPYSFTINNSILYGGSVTNLNEIQYFIVAQDTSNNLSSLPTGASSNNTPAVANINSKPSTLFSYTIYTASIAGNINVGTGQTYTSLTRAGGLFEALNTKIINGNITAIVTSDLTEDGTFSLNEFSENNYSSGYLFSIIPNSTIVRTVSGTNVPNNTPMINFNGTDNVVIDGRYNYSGQYLLFRNTNTNPLNTGPAIMFNNSCFEGYIRNIFVETNAASSTTASLVFGETGENYASILFNTFRDAIEGTVGQPSSLIYSNSTSNSLYIVGNQFINFNNFGLNLPVIGNETTISGNYFYCTTDQFTSQTCISILSGNNHLIENNIIGGSDDLNEGTWLNTAAVDFKGISIGGSTSIANSIQNNYMRNIHLSNLGASTFVGIEIKSGLADVGTIFSNTIGQWDLLENIKIDGSSTSVGISSSSTSDVNISNNYINNISATGTGANVSLIGIHDTGSGKSIIETNEINLLKSNSSSPSLHSIIAIGGIVSSNSNQEQLISKNNINNLHALNANSPINCTGIVMNVNVGACTLSKNLIYNLTNESTDSASIICGIQLLSGNSSVSNNMISISNGINTNNPHIKGIAENTLNANSHNLLNNTIYIEGTSSSTINSSCLERNSECSISLINNILINYRTGGTGKHYALTNFATTPSNGWAINSSNYNILMSLNSSTIGYWAGDRNLNMFKSISGGDHHSKSMDVYFANPSNGDLHLSGTSIGDSNLRGLYLAQITDDIDDFTRPLLYPYKGADEVFNNPLPIELLKFIGFAKQDFNVLTWTTASEINSDYFEVERLTSDKTFETISRITASGNSREINQYQFHDATFTKTNAIEYYRLKMVDLDNHFKYSDVIAVKRNGEVKASISLYPNPSAEILNVTISNVDVAKIQVKILDLIGKVVYENNELMSNEINSIQIADFPSGIYTLQVVGLTENLNQRFIKK